MKIIDAETTRAALPFDRLIAALRTMFVTGCEVPARHVHQPVQNSTVLIMPAWTDRYLGIKTVNIWPGNGARGLPGLFSTYLLYDATSGEPLAQIDGDQITSRRTAAASALAASYLAREESSRLLVMGSGRVGQLIPEAFRAVLPITQVSVWSRGESGARSMVSALGHQGFDAIVADDAAAAAMSADIVSCATLATSPVVEGRWLQPGSHLDLIGSFTPAMREADDDCFRGAQLWLDTDEGLRKSGDLLGPLERKVITPADVRGTLADLCSNDVKVARRSRTVFKSVGTALEDLAAAILVYEQVR